MCVNKVMKEVILLQIAEMVTAEHGYQTPPCTSSSVIMQFHFDSSIKLNQYHHLKKMPF